MKIQISTNNREFRIGIPTGLIFSKPSVWLYMKIAGKSTFCAERYMPADVNVSVSSIFEKMPEEAVYAICDELRRIKRKHGSWELVNVESSDGTHVKITL